MGKQKKHRFKARSSRYAKAVDIDKATKQEVFLRDEGRCIFCGNMYNVMPNSHFVPRSKGGLGIARNILTACTNFTENQCHYRFDNGTAEERERMTNHAREYLQSKYPDWDESKLYYRKFEREEYKIDTAE